MSYKLSSFEQQIGAVSYIDCIGAKQLSVRDLLPLLLNSSGDLTADLEHNSAAAAKIIRIVIDAQQLRNQVAEINTAIKALNTENVQIVCELLLTTEQLSDTVDIQQCSNQLLQLAQLSNLLICDLKLFTAITGAQLLAENSQQHNAQLLADLSLKSVVLRSGPVTPCWFYCTTTNQGSLAFTNQLSETVLNTESGNVKFTSRGSLSAAITAFMLNAKRSCDALVLALAYLHQQSERATVQPLPECLTASAQAWPCDLHHYPTLDTGLAVSKLAAFAPTDTLSLGLYPVVDSISWLERLLKLGVKTIQLRIKDTAAEQLEKLIEKAAQLGSLYKARLFINDYWQLAIKYQCYGVHLGQEDLDTTDLSAIAAAGLRLGISTHSEYEWLRAIAIKPSYIAMGTVYPTQTKPAILIGLINLQRWCKTLAEHYPLVAIGGIKLNNIEPVLATGVGSIAVVTAITTAEDYPLATRQLTQLQQPQRRV